MDDEREPLTVPAPALRIDRWERWRRFAARALLGWVALLLLDVVLVRVGSDEHTGAKVLLVLLMAALPLGLLALGAIAIRQLLARRRASAGSLRIDEAELVVAVGATERRYALGELGDGWIEDTDEVHLRTRGGDHLVARVQTTGAAETLLARAGLDASRRVLTVPLEPAAASIPAAGVLLATSALLLSPLALFGLLATLAGALRMLTSDGGGETSGMLLGQVVFACITCGALYGMRAALRRREAVIGTDGIVFRGALRKVFLPYSRIARVWRAPRGVRVLLRGASRSILLPTAGALRVARRREARRDRAPHAQGPARADRAGARRRSHGRRRERQRRAARPQGPRAGRVARRAQGPPRRASRLQDGRALARGSRAPHRGRLRPRRAPRRRRGRALFAGPSRDQAAREDRRRGLGRRRSARGAGGRRGGGDRRGAAGARGPPRRGPVAPRRRAQRDESSTRIRGGTLDCAG